MKMIIEDAEALKHEVAHWRCGDLWSMKWLIGYVVALG